MPSHADPRDSYFDEYVPLAALGDPIPADIAAHQQTCPTCQSELTSLRSIAALARESVVYRDFSDVHPPRSVWAGIATDLQIPVDPAVVAAAPARPRRRAQLRHLLVAACTVLVVVAAGAGGYVLGHHQKPTLVLAVGPAHLIQMPGGPLGVTGTATVRTGAGGNLLTLSTTGLPTRDGYYEVWLFDPAVNSMVAIGTLGSGESGTYPLPSRVDLSAYDTVDVSAQDYTGGAVITHAQSVLRGRFLS